MFFNLNFQKYCKLYKIHHNCKVNNSLMATLCMFRIVARIKLQTLIVYFTGALPLVYPCYNILSLTNKPCIMLGIVQFQKNKTQVRTRGRVLGGVWVTTS